MTSSNNENNSKNNNDDASSVTNKSTASSTTNNNNGNNKKKSSIIVGKGLELVGDASPDGKRVKFIYQLYQILERRMCMDVVSWLPNGKTFAVFDKTKFEMELMPLLLGSSAKFPSFVRRLLRWNFKQANDGSTCLFANPFFQSGMPRLLKQLRSKESKIGQLEQRLLQQQMFGTSAGAGGLGRSSTFGSTGVSSYVGVGGGLGGSSSSAYGGVTGSTFGGGGSMTLSSLGRGSPPPAVPEIAAARETVENERRSALRRLQELDVLSSRLATINNNSNNAAVTPPSPPGFGASFSGGSTSHGFGLSSTGNSFRGGLSGLGGTGTSFSTNRNVKNILPGGSTSSLLNGDSFMGGGLSKTSTASGRFGSMLDNYPGSFNKSSLLGGDNDYGTSTSTGTSHDSFAKMLSNQRRRHLEFMNTSNEARLIQQETIARLNKWMGNANGNNPTLSPTAASFH